MDYRYLGEQACSCLEKMMVFCDSALLNTPRSDFGAVPLSREI
jgi:hypothetical protein